ncbi:uncharacterized protein LOC125648701 [Ostrea edulis]|uniref:uncharacterized protein LOC125648701 n=1 Tax=Ostrea edulis TaxID=37623 RepID=UPI0024AE9A2C|nr:uncharacterized protein LOC125648701 [Ostrea edulis]
MTVIPNRPLTHAPHANCGKLVLILKYLSHAISCYSKQCYSVISAGPPSHNLQHLTNALRYKKLRQKIVSQNKETDKAKEVPKCQETGTCQLYQSSHAVDGDINTCTRTAPFGTTTPDKWTWWYVDLEKVLSIYSIRIQFKDNGEQYVMRQRGRFAGFSLYVSNTTIKEDGYLCYKNGQELPTLDFSTTCVKYARYVIFYNERLDGTTYPTGYQTTIVFTELCEVTVTGCKDPGVYGYNCDLPCPNNCQELRCDIVNGTCLGCTAGWVGGFCNKSCPAGYYGLQCRSTCTGHCRDNLSCNQTTGQCDYGCDNGWTGIHCNTRNSFVVTLKMSETNKIHILTVVEFFKDKNDEISMHWQQEDVTEVVIQDIPGNSVIKVDVESVV